VVVLAIDRDRVYGYGCPGILLLKQLKEFVRSIYAYALYGFINNCTQTIIVQENANNLWLTTIGWMLFAVFAIFFLHWLTRQDCNYDRVTPYNVAFTKPSHSEPITTYPTIETRQSHRWHKTAPLRSPNADGWGKGWNINKLRAK
jgi:hypothetical protein